MGSSTSLLPLEGFFLSGRASEWGSFLFLFQYHLRGWVWSGSAGALGFSWINFFLVLVSVISIELWLSTSLFIFLSCFSFSSSCFFPCTALLGHRLFHCCCWDFTHVPFFCLCLGRPCNDSLRLPLISFFLAGLASVETSVIVGIGVSGSVLLWICSRWHFGYHFLWL